MSIHNVRSLWLPPAQDAPPEFDDRVAERREGTRVGGHGVVCEEAPYHAAQPSTLLGHVLVAASPEVLSYFQQLRLFPITPRVAAQHEVTPPRA